MQQIGQCCAWEYKPEVVHGGVQAGGGVRGIQARGGAGDRLEIVRGDTGQRSPWDIGQTWCREIEVRNGADGCGPEKVQDDTTQRWCRER